MPFAIVPKFVQTSALLADSWPPLAKDVSLAGYLFLSNIVTL